MIIVNRLILREPGGDGRIEVTVSHNNKPGCAYEAREAWEDVLKVFLADSRNEVELMYPRGEVGCWGES